VSLFDPFQKRLIILLFDSIGLFGPLTQPANILGNLLNQPNHAYSDMVLFSAESYLLFPSLVDRKVKHEEQRHLASVVGISVGRPS
jgi:hypothetical protein